MINTYQTSMALPQVPPPVPPRLGRSQPILIPAPLQSQGYNKPLLRFLVCLVMLHFLLSVGGFLYLYYNERKIAHESHSSPQGRVGFPPVEKQDTTYRVLARVVVKSYAPKEGKAGNLQLDTRHTVLKNIDYFRNSWLTIREPGDYFVYSRVTFSRSNPFKPLASWVKLRKSMKEDGEDGEPIMKAYCNLGDSTNSELNPQMCTATQQDVIALERGNQLSIWVANLSLVDYDKAATSFGMYKL